MNTQEKVRLMIEGSTAQIMSMLMNTIGKGAFSDTVEETQRIVNDLGSQILQIVCAEADDVFNAERDRNKVIIKHKDKTRRLLTTLGEVTLHRRLYYDKIEARYFFAADELLQIDKRARIEKGMQAQLIADATRSSYGKAAEIAHRKVSRQTVHNIVRRLNDERLKVRAEGLKTVEHIYIEADEDHIHLNNGSPAEVRLIYVHEGVRQVCRGRRELINPKYFVSVSTDNDTTWNDVADYVYGQYRVSKAQLHISGDGAQWIKYGLMIFPKAQYHLDKFHVYKSVTDVVGGDRVLRRQIIDALSDSNYERVRALYGARLQSLTKPGERENVRAGLFYIENNFDEIDLTPATSCAAEGHVSHVLSARMSSRPMAWSKDGAHRIARLRAYYFNGGDFRDVVADRQHGVPQRRENTTEKYRRFNSETDGRKAANDYCSAHLVGIDGITNGLSAALRAIIKRGNRKW
jgi:hypothetical protein